MDVPRLCPRWDRHGRHGDGPGSAMAFLSSPVGRQGLHDWHGGARAVASIIVSKMMFFRSSTYLLFTLLVRPLLLSLIAVACTAAIDRRCALGKVLRAFGSAHNYRNTSTGEGK